MRVSERRLALEARSQVFSIEQLQPDCLRCIYVPTEREWPPPDGRDDGPSTPRELGRHVPHKPGGLLTSGRIPVLTMCQYIERQNVDRFTKCLSTEADLAKRIILLKLLGEERAKQAKATLDTR
jgi:hypothetical protein